MAHAAQTDLKARHYTQQLQSVLTRGAWADSVPAHAAKGSSMTWAELIRKFKKHCVSHHSEFSSSLISSQTSLSYSFDGLNSIVTAELALQSQSLSLLLLSNNTDVKHVTPEDLDGDSEEPLGSLELGHECELTRPRVEDARHGFAALELLNDTPDERDVRLLLSF
jgi:hypothetical protein